MSVDDYNVDNGGRPPDASDRGEPRRSLVAERRPGNSW